MYTVYTYVLTYVTCIGHTLKRLNTFQGHYYDVLSADAEISSAISKVSAHLETSARQCRSLRNKFLSYSFMWEDDVEESFELFLKGQYAPYERHLLTRPQTVRASARSTHGGRYILCSVCTCAGLSHIQYLIYICMYVHFYYTYMLYSIMKLTWSYHVHSYFLHMCTCILGIYTVIAVVQTHVLSMCILKYCFEIIANTTCIHFTCVSGLRLKDLCSLFTPHTVCMVSNG